MKIISLADLLSSLGASAVKRLLEAFSCRELNKDVDSYLKRWAVPHTKRKTSMTHIVFAPSGEIAAYFTLTSKPLTICFDTLDADTVKRLNDVARVDFDNDRKSYRISAYLIAQVAKNLATKEGRGLSGSDLFAAIYDQIRKAQGIIGGKVVFLEYERDRPKLLEAYTKMHKFREFPMPSAEDKGKRLGQLFRFLD
jgi:hypothetical protein